MHFMDSFVNLGEEVILTLLWQSGASKSATVCFVISLSICYWLLKLGVLLIVCVCGGGVCVWVCVCVCERERITVQRRVCVFVCFCVLSCVREGDGHTTTGCELQTHTSFMLHSRQVFKTVSHNFKPHDSWLCSVPGGGKKVHKAREAVIPFFTLYCPKVYFSLCTTCINTASAGAAIVVSRAMWHQSA